MLGALVEWGYQPSEVERILLGEEQPITEAGAGDAVCDDNAVEASDSAA
jgi:ParB family chromosome partitioning protein